VDSGPLTGRPLLSLVTGGSRGVSSYHDVSMLFGQVGAAVAAGIDLIQIREPELQDRVLLEIVRRCVDMAHGTGTIILVNDRLDVALAAGAGGAHLRTRSVPAPVARRHAPDGFLLGRSVHGAAEAARVADGGGLDYLVMGTVFSSRSKPGAPACGVSRFGAVAHAVDLPVLAVGGVTVDKAVEVFRAGAAGVAAIGLFARLGPSGRFDEMCDVVGELRRSYRSVVRGLRGATSDGAPA